MFFVKDPARFQMVVTPNLFGDIITDLGGTAKTGEVGDAIIKYLTANK